MPIALVVGYLFPVPTVADQLRQAREAMQLDIQQVVDATKLKADQVLALESGDYDAFSAPIYLRGSLRTYARLLKLDGQQLSAQLDAELGASGRGEEPSLVPAGRKSGVDSFMLVLSRVNWSIAAVLIALAIVVFGGNAAYRAWRNHKSNDPLKKLSSGLYQPPPESGETLPVPTNTSRR